MKSLYTTPVLALVTAGLFGCTEFEVINDSSGEVAFQIAHARHFDDDDVDIATHTLAAGASTTVTVNLPAGVDEARIVATGAWVNTFDQVPRGDDGPGTYTIVDNAGAARISNTGDEAVSSVWFSNTANMDDDWAFGAGNWGDDHGPLEPGDSVEITGLFPGDSWAVRFDGTVRVSPLFEVTVGEWTEVEIGVVE